MGRQRIVVCLLLTACNLGVEADDPQIDMTELSVVSPETRRSRAAAVRDVAAQAGVTNGALLAGIAQVETGFAHCWSEATWACQGPYSDSCGGPVIAGAADGPCSAQQGGLGMFQFDAGTFDQTLARDGVEILLEAGNIAHAVEFVLARIVEEIPEATDFQSAAQWMNSIPIEPGHPLFERWGELTSCRYNGCCAASCGGQRAKYKDAAVALYYEFEPGFWDAEAASCGTIAPAGGVVDDVDQCAYAGGNPDYWRHADTGYGGSLKWTHTTDFDAPANYAQWQLEFQESGVYLVEAYIQSGENAQSQLATYNIDHAAGTTDVILDQSAGSEWEALGEFEFDAGKPYQIRLNDNTGEPNDTMTRLAFDAIQFTRVVDDEPGVEGPGPEPATDLSGGCSVGKSHSGSSAPWLLLIAAVALRRRRRRM